mmetsp:Transcript_97308/g.156907  ORF Transcript_97308/g.156907 Transcript_97308/m.156907 type:complete len:96 (+) Transcript_97308:357-644(+)
MDNVIDLDLIFSKMYTLVDRNILVSPDGWAPILYASKLTGIDEIMKVNQQSVTDMRIAVQYKSGWKFFRMGCWSRKRQLRSLPGIQRMGMAQHSV